MLIREINVYNIIHLEWTNNALNIDFAIETGKSRMEIVRVMLKFTKEKSYNTTN